MCRKWRNSWRNTAESSSSILQQRGTASFSNTRRTSSGMARIFSIWNHDPSAHNQSLFRTKFLFAYLRRVFFCQQIEKMLRKGLHKMPVIANYYCLVCKKHTPWSFQRYEKIIREKRVQIPRANPLCYTPYKPVLKPVKISLPRDQT